MAVMDVKNRKVQTAYGEGVILDFREEDSMFLVKLHGMTTSSAAALLYTQNLKIIQEENKREQSVSMGVTKPSFMARSCNTQKSEDAASYRAQSCDKKTEVVSTQHHRESTTSTEKEQVSDVLLQNFDGKPLFPLLYKMRREGQDFLDQSSQHIAAAMNSKEVAACKTASLQAMSVAQSNIKDLARILSKPEEENAKSVLHTPYGVGTVLEYRQLSATYVVQLSFGILYTQDVPQALRAPKKKTKNALELNETFLKWQETRRQEQQEDCERLGIPYTNESMHKCFACLKAPPAAYSKPALMNNADGKPLFPRLYKLRQIGEDMIANKAVVPTDSPCLLCGSMVCAKHASPAFRKEGVSVCMECVGHLEYDFEGAHLPHDLDRQTKHLVDLYGRAILLLQYCSQFMLATADDLEQNTKQHNEIAGVGGSSAGLVSGVLGVAAACTIFTPVGPPLLISSLVFGGSATAVQAGSEAYKFYNEPNQLANRILTLQGVVDMILGITKSIRDTTLVPYLDQAVLALEATTAATTNATGLTPRHNAKAAVRAGTCIGSTAVTSAAAGLMMQETAVAGRFASRATTAAARTARFARFAGGALSAATLVLEARELRKTLDQIKLGNPCEKALAVRNIHANLNKLPSAASVESVCRCYVKVRSKEMFRQTMAERSVQLPKQEEEELVLVEEVVSSLEESQEDRSTASPSDHPRAKLSSRTSLLHRVKRYKEREAAKLAKEQ